MTASICNAVRNLPPLQQEDPCSFEDARDRGHWEQLVSDGFQTLPTVLFKTVEVLVDHPGESYVKSLTLCSLGGYQPTVQMLLANLGDPSR